MQKKRLNFGDSQHECVGVLNLQIPDFDHVAVKFDAYIVSIDVPILIKLDALRQPRLTVNFENGSIQSPKGDWSINLVHKFGCHYAGWPTTVYYTGN